MYYFAFPQLKCILNINNEKEEEEEKKKPQAGPNSLGLTLWGWESRRSGLIAQSSPAVETWMHSEEQMWNSS